MLNGRSCVLPRRIQVGAVLSSRYGDARSQAEVRASQWFVPELHRPLSWDERRAGVDVICTSSGEELKLVSSGMQSTPKPGWVLLLTSGSAEDGFSWTLYGLPASH
jgi:hypothetical protein